MIANYCHACNHSLVDNDHGPDQNDYVWSQMDDTYVHNGYCCYCVKCQQGLDRDPLEVAQ